MLHQSVSHTLPESAILFFELLVMIVEFVESFMELVNASFIFKLGLVPAIIEHLLQVIP